MAAVGAMLQSFRLEQYAAAFDEAGYDDVGYIRILKDDALSELVETVGMKPGHAAKFRAFLSGELA